jgi:hypothetical protein
MLKSSKERLRVAVVGGGAAGLSTALHLAPLVAQGLIAGPIDVYDSNERHHGRDIGVGIWSTALEGFDDDDDDKTIDSHRLVYQDMTRVGTFIGKVGYRSPSGAWLAESNLQQQKPLSSSSSSARSSFSSLPQLLFLRECDMIAALQKAVHLEVQRGNVMLHTGSNYKVKSILEDSSTEPWAAPLVLKGNNNAEASSEITERDYHLIVAGTLHEVADECAIRGKCCIAD